MTKVHLKTFRRVTRSRGPHTPGRIASALRHFLAASGSVAADDGDSPARRGRMGSRSGRTRLGGVGRSSSWLAVVSTVVLAGCATVLTPRASNGLPRFYQVDDGLSRGAQPTPEGVRRLAQMGVKTVISLRRLSRASEEERRLVEQLGMRWVNLPMWFWWRPSDQQVRQFLSITTDPASRPVFVHCRQGWNRAGIMVAVYRIVHQGWTPHHAYAEARQFGLVPWNVMSRHLLFHGTQRKFMSFQPGGA